MERCKRSTNQKEGQEEQNVEKIERCFKKNMYKVSNLGVQTRSWVGDQTQIYQGGYQEGNNCLECKEKYQAYVYNGEDRKWQAKVLAID